MKKVTCILLTVMTVLTFIIPINSSAVSFSNSKSYSNVIVMGDRWNLISGGKRAYTSRKYFGVKLSKLTSLDYSKDYTYMKARIVNENGVILSTTQTLAKSSTAIYQFDLLVMTNDTVYLSAKGNKKNLDARATGVFYAN